MIEKYEELLNKKNVNLIYLGVKTKNNQSTGQRSIVVGVKKKIPIEELEKEEVIPKVLGSGVPTDVIEVGEIEALNLINQKYHRPILGGISIGPNNGAGTLGCIIEKDGKKYGITNRHVVDYKLEGVKHEIRQPAIMDGGKEIIGKVVGLSKIELPKHKPDNLFKRIVAVIVNFFYIFKNFITRKKISRNPTNEVDAAIFSLNETVRSNNEILGIGVRGTGISTPKIGMTVFSSGRTSGTSKGKISGLEGRSSVRYEDGVAVFTNQIVVSNLTVGPGDSGSIIVDGSNRVVGMLFAGGKNINGEYTAIVNRADSIQTEMGINF